MTTGDSAALRPHTLAFKNRVIRTPAMVSALEAIGKCRKTSGTDPKSMFIVGPSGAGKSTIAKAFLGENPAEEQDDRTVRPVLYGSLKKGSDRSIMATLLKAACDPAPASGRNMDDMIQRLEALVRNCRTRLIIIDEIHHVLPEHSTTRAQLAADLLKALIDELGVPFVLVGLPESVRLLQAQRKGDVYKDQLRRRFRKTVLVDPPALDSKGWKRLIAAYQEAIAVPCIRLGGEEMLSRLYLATSGLPGRLSNLFAEALEASDGCAQITLDDLAAAFEEASSVHDIPENPFRVTRHRVDRYLNQLGMVA